ncbi:MAG: PTS sugar transporter subunit IIA [Woeseia sp.]
MKLEDLVKPDNVLCNAQARSKKHCLEILSELLSRSDSEISHEEIFERLVERERLGCTGLDSGIAFPHCRVEGAKRSAGALMKLSSPVDFDTSDSEHVDLVFGLMVPQELGESHYADIRLIASALNDQGLRTRLREAKSSSELYQALLTAKPPPAEAEAEAEAEIDSTSDASS